LFGGGGGGGVAEKNATTAFCFLHARRQTTFSFQHAGQISDDRPSVFTLKVTYLSAGRRFN
jgi:hypothetical protein